MNKLVAVLRRHQHEILNIKMRYGMLSPMAETNLEKELAVIASRILSESGLLSPETRGMAQQLAQWASSDAVTERMIEEGDRLSLLVLLDVTETTAEETDAEVLVGGIVGALRGWFRNETGREYG
jgi:hypothetical protein